MPVGGRACGLRPGLRTGIERGGVIGFSLPPNRPLHYCPAVQFTALIDAVVRQTTVLLAHLATAAGVRAPLAHLANQVFLDLVQELESQGLGRKVVADMFGIALRSYQIKVRRLSESSTERNRTLWEAVLALVRDEGPVNRARVLDRHRHDDEGQVRAILHDLVDSGLVYQAGRGDGTTYRAADPAELGAAFTRDPGAMAAHFTWVVVYTQGPVDRTTLLQTTRLDEAALDAALAALEADARVERVQTDEGLRWRCEHCILPETTVGFEAALFDHYQAMVTAICIKLRGGQARSVPGDAVGGSTWSMDVWTGHPFEAEVLGTLRELRGRVSTLRQRVTAYNEQHPARPEVGRKRVTVYVGQSVVADEEESNR